MGCQMFPLQTPSQRKKRGLGIAAKNAARIRLIGKSMGYQQLAPQISSVRGSSWLP
jgi:hypothetical protein